MIYKLIPLFIAILLSIPAMAEDPKREEKEATFKSLDRDDDQRLSQSEVKGDRVLAARFKVLDTDRDGQLTMTEYAAHTEPVSPNE
jgi:hypothetical protein